MCWVIREDEINMFHHEQISIAKIENKMKRNTLCDKYMFKE